ncbi:HD domain-containing phosphohydrolase [Haliea sp. E17]|uniref:HD domain-containing phosphohydrolase n=1 Tax=Haliea sp. E17 TaxID=3401576 RepID=UPI003AAC8A03
MKFLGDRGLPLIIATPRTSIRLTVVTVFVIATALTATVAIGLQYHFSDSLGRRAASELYTSTAEGIARELAGIRQLNVNILDLLAQNSELANPAARENELLRTFLKVLENNPLFYGIYVGREDGSFYEIVNLNASHLARKTLLALPSDRWVVVTVKETPEGRLREYQYLSAALALRATRSEATQFNVTERPWYRDSVDSDTIKATAPYLFAQSGEPGRTLSRRINNTRAVIGIDTTLGTISENLANTRVSLDSKLFLFNRDGLVVASSMRGSDTAAEIPLPDFPLSREDRLYLKSLGTLVVSNEMDWPPIDYAQGGGPRGYSVDVIHLIARMLGVQVRFENGYNWEELVGRFREGKIDLLQSASARLDTAGKGDPGRPYASFPYALVSASDSGELTSLAQLANRKLAIPAGWAILPVVREHYPEIEIVEASSTLDAIRKVKTGEVSAALDMEVILQYIISHYYIDGVKVVSPVDLGFEDTFGEMHIVVHSDQPRLRAIIDRAIAALGPAQKMALANKWLQFDGSQVTVESETVPSSDIVTIANNPEQWGKLTTLDINGQEEFAYIGGIEDADEDSLYLGILTPVTTVMNPYLDKVKLSIKITALFLLLLLPLSWLFAIPIVRPVKQLAAENDKVRDRKLDEVKRVRTHILELDDLSESLVEMVDSIRTYEAAQRALMDSFIQLIAQAIDDKSPYTASHCARVPELALMLARAASESEAPPFNQFRLEGEDQWREYRIAAWLHDCGKITTPEHVVDKGSKLETIYNRIHEVRMRFEVLSRDAEIHFWEALQQYPEQRAELQAQLVAVQRELQDDFAFIAQCNVGGEYFDEEKQQRLRAIAQKTWQRRFSDRLGLSPVEELRHRGDEPALPVNEPLLADKPEHIVERTAATDYPPEYGIHMDIPQHLYNQGELYNLSISRGTLTPEDRFKINEHMISTIKMLESLPFPEELKNVPRYASTHHETMRGDGYPRRLPGDALSIPERLLAIADVFEALTAADRPYKKAKPVSVAIAIMARMVADNHIDRDCFELFLTSGTYRRYAEQYLQPAQVDAVDIGQYLA